MSVLPEYKNYLVKITAEKFKLDHTFAEVLIETIEEEHTLKGYEDKLREFTRYGELYNYYFHNKNRKGGINYEKRGVRNVQ